MNINYLIRLILLTVFLMDPLAAAAQPEGFNYDESEVPEYKLPDPLKTLSGQTVESATQWPQRRKELFQLFQGEVYGRSPKPHDSMEFELDSVDADALEGAATRKLVSVYFAGKTDGRKMEILIYLPAKRSGPVPVFLGLNFYGNHTIHADPGIPLSRSWMRANEKMGVVDNRATEASRGKAANRWDVDTILERGYGLATIYYGDIDPDFHDEFQNGVHPIFDKAEQNERAGDQWGSIAAWSWGLSRALDYFETDSEIDHDRVAVMGHSRLGKTALWAGASDPRFALVISNNSGCGGAALSRRRFGETVKRINDVFPHWFCGNFKQYNEHEDALPIDQHMLVALMAPRPVYVASAQEDVWADPRGEFLSAVHADPVFRLLGTIGLPIPGADAQDMPAVDQPLMGKIGYHIRTGKHDVTEFDWQCYLDFADKHLR